MLICCNFPPCLNPSLPSSPQARLLELVDRDICPFAMTELLSPQLPMAWRSYLEITVVLLDDSPDAAGWFLATAAAMLHCSSRLHSVQTLADTSDFGVVSVCVVE